MDRDETFKICSYCVKNKMLIQAPAQEMDEFINFLCLLSPSQGHYRSAVQTGKKNLLMLLSGEAHLIIRFNIFLLHLIY